MGSATGVLALDTSTALTVAALWDAARGVDAEVAVDPPAGGRPLHAQALLEAAVATLAEGGGSWEQVGRIAVGIGPGTFTGLRIGIAAAQGLARALGRPLVPVSSLASLAASATAAEAGAGRFVLAVIDARRGEIFVGGDGLVPSVLAPEDLAERARDRLAVGDGAVRFRAALEAAGAVVPADDSVLHRVSARMHCRLALNAPPVAPERVLPCYVRLPDAEVAR
ncbi:tRNA (adenosine(37)-N6)-threonylcarbamoyltransferase complex dimerization subunit type 1 TsaB [Conexibacter sp. DBS9H8]|uniref:tRNA (adenosine(37)-N6)-threonylcarbamoyltransferase complex dimerization subunit type 1 TsaB n=1 Tax=Conexibacter sp. DBS9H8 TaxID=2937801 RepID=UPI0020109629|nr:tRNA (adenosine(37)-N6)-threonylcarbamoyltransferase complex dimerization subunit type 1 TsaB [Conexibacter sp. DBS9H8]